MVSTPCCPTLSSLSFSLHSFRRNYRRRSYFHSHLCHERVDNPSRRHRPRLQLMEGLRWLKYRRCRQRQRSTLVPSSTMACRGCCPRRIAGRRCMACAGVINRQLRRRTELLHTDCEHCRRLENTSSCYSYARCGASTGRTIIRYITPQTLTLARTRTDICITDPHTTLTHPPFTTRQSYAPLI